MSGGESRAQNPALADATSPQSHDVMDEALAVEFATAPECEWCAAPIEGRGARFCSPECWADYQRDYPHGVPKMTHEERIAEMEGVFARLGDEAIEMKIAMQIALDELRLYTRLMEQQSPGDQTGAPPIEQGDSNE